MKGIAIIENDKVPVKEYAGQRVLTFKDIDTMHGRSKGTASKRFYYHARHYTQGQDYFELAMDDAMKAFGLTAPNGLIVLTESGYMLMVKSLNDDLAWQVQKRIADSYMDIA